VSTEEVAAGRQRLLSKEDLVNDDNDKIASPDQPSPYGADEAHVVIDFAVGPPGVGPVMGFDSDDFTPSPPDADTDRSRTD
jgi:hypothetical protein